MSLDSSATEPASSPQSKSKWKPITLLAVVIGILILAKWLNIDSWLKETENFIKGFGPWGPLVFILLYIGTTVAALPGTAMTLIAGALFGSIWGVVIVSMASTTGAALCFLIARYFAREAAAKWLSQKTSFHKLDQLTEQHGSTIVALTRLVPLFPFNLLNYGFGLTRVDFTTYVFWSWLCMLPGTILYVSAADAISQLLTKGQVSWPLVAWIGIMFVIITFLVRDARRKLNEKQNEFKMT